MKKTILLAIAAVTAVFASCTKENATINESTPVKLIPKTFTVSAADTKTILGENGRSMLWAEDDAISVIGVTDGNVASVHEFTITSGIGEASAEFSGEVGDNETTFYAVYPSSATLKLDDEKAPFSNGYITVEKALPAPIKAIKGGIDSRRAVMIAKADSDGKLAFQHGVSYLKFKVADENVASITVNFGNNIGGRPSYTYTEGEGFSLAKTQGNTSNLVIKPESGTFETDGFYYFPFFSTNKMGTVTLTYTHTNKSSVQVNTGDTFNNITPAIGTIYNLGTPPVSFAPQISANDVNLEATAESGSISFTVLNPVDGGSMAAALKESSDWLTLGEVSNGSVAFTCSANTGDARSAVVTLTYTYNNSTETVIKDVTVNQSAAGGGSEPIIYKWNFTEDNASISSTKTGYIYKYYNGGITQVTTASETNILYVQTDTSKEFKTGSKTVNKVKNIYVTYGGAAVYMFFNTASSGTLRIKATVGKSLSESGDVKIGILINDVSSGDDVELDHYDGSATDLGMKQYSWTIPNTTGNVQKISIKKISGASSPWFFEIEFEED